MEKNSGKPGVVKNEPEGIVKKYIVPRLIPGGKWLARYILPGVILAVNAQGLVVNGDDYISRFSRGVVDTETRIIRTITPPYGSSENTGKITIEPAQQTLEAAAKSYIFPVTECEIGLGERVVTLEAAPMVSPEFSDEHYRKQIMNIFGTIDNRVNYGIVCQGTRGNGTFSDDPTLESVLKRENAYEALQRAINESGYPDGYAKAFLFDANGAIRCDRLELEDLLAHYGVTAQSNEGKMVARRYQILKETFEGLLTGEIENPFNENVTDYKSLNTDKFPDVPTEIEWDASDERKITVVESDIHMMGSEFPLEYNHVYGAIWTPNPKPGTCEIDLLHKQEIQTPSPVP